MVELTLSTSDNDNTPESPIGFHVDNYKIKMNKNEKTLRFNEVSEELTFNASDNEEAPKWLMELSNNMKSIQIKKHKIGKPPISML